MKKLVLMLAVVFGMTMVSCDNTATNNGEGQDTLNADTTMVEAPAPAPADSMQPADSVKPAEEAKADAAPKAEEPKAEEPKAEEPAK